MNAAAAIAAPLAVALLALAGCQNPGISIVGAEAGALPDIHADQTPELPREGDAVALDGSPVTAMPAPQTTTLDRSGWPTREVHQPRGQVEVQPTYYRLYEGNAADPRANGSYPTVNTALATGGGRPTAVQDMAAAPVVGIFWLAITPGQVIALPPWTVRRQPTGDGVEWLPATPEVPPAPSAPNTPPAPSAPEP